MNKSTASAFGERASAYRDYLEGPYGRLRQEVAWHRISVALERGWGETPVPLRILDAGCGPGELALRLAQKGHQVTLLDPVEGMLRLAQGKAEALSPPPAFPPRFLQSALEEAPSLFQEEIFDFALCHFLLEYLPDPRPALTALHRLLRPGGLLSLVTLNRWQEPLHLAIRDRRFQEAQRALIQTTSTDPLFGLSRVTFRREELKPLLEETGFEILEEGGIAIFVNYLPKEAIEEPSSFEALLSLEEEAGKSSPLKDVARYLHLFGRRV